jgi:hypothetical protein
MGSSQRTLILRESQLRGVIGRLVREETQLHIVERIRDFLDSHYEKGEEMEIDEKGNYSNRKVIGVKADSPEEGQVVVTNISPRDLFLKLETVFSNVLEKGEKRDAFLKQVICDWYNGTIGEYGTLTKNISF